MDLLGILKDLRQKGIDANQIDVLKSAYEHQNLLVEQLKESNAALKESNDLMKEKVKKLEAENIQLKNEINSLRATATDTESSSLSNEAVDILKLCAKQDVTEFFEMHMVSMLNKGAVVAKRAMGELRTNSFIIQSRAITDTRGPLYRITQSGLRYMAKLDSSDESLAP